MKDKVSFMCLNPQGVLDIPKPSGLNAPRVKELTGKNIAIIWDGKKGGDNYCIAIEELLNGKQVEYPKGSVTFKKAPKPKEKQAKHGDLFNG